MLAFDQLRDAGREFDDFEPARDFPQRIRQQLALLARDHLRQRLLALSDQFAEAEQHPRPAPRRKLRPGLEGPPGRG